MIISIIIPALNEEQDIQLLLSSLSEYKNRGHEIILVDGGSTDNTINIARPMVTQCISSEKGRAKQMNAGAKAAKGDVLLFLHADTFLPENADRFILESLNPKQWGRFDVQLSGDHFLFRIIETMIYLVLGQFQLKL